MVSESIVILLVLIFALVLTLKAKKENYFIFLLPTLAVPVVYLVGTGVMSLLQKTDTRGQTVHILLAAAGGLIGAVTSILLAKSLKSEKNRAGYAAFGICVSIGLTAAYLVNLV